MISSIIQQKVVIWKPSFSAILPTKMYQLYPVFHGLSNGIIFIRTNFDGWRERNLSQNFLLLEIYMWYWFFPIKAQLTVYLMGYESSMDNNTNHVFKVRVDLNIKHWDIIFFCPRTFCEDCTMFLFCYTFHYCGTHVYLQRK